MLLLPLLLLLLASIASEQVHVACTLCFVAAPACGAAVANPKHPGWTLVDLLVPRVKALGAGADSSLLWQLQL